MNKLIPIGPRIKAPIPIEEMEYVSSLKAFDGEKLITSFLAQIYCVGMYVIIDNNPAMQLNIENKKYPNWVKASIKKMEKHGYRIEITKSLMVNHLSVEEVKTYIL